MLDIPTPVTPPLKSGARAATQDWGAVVAELRAEIHHLREALSQPCQSCDASARLSSDMCQLQEDLKAQRAITQSLELAVAELRQVHRVGLANVQPVSDAATVTPSVTPAALAEAVARSPPPVAEPTPAARLPPALRETCQASPGPCTGRFYCQFPALPKPCHHL